MSRRGLRRSHSFSRLYGSVASYQAATEAPSDALSVIRSAGYPHELHMVTTPDGYVLRLERIPRPGARDVAFFMHGVLDTSMAWVSGGVTGSQAFAAWEAGLDVWLGNSRGNAPRQHSDPAYRGGRYWRYNINHMGMYDIAAQLDHIHNIKCSELGAGSVTLDLDHLGPLAGSFLGGGLAASGGSGTPSAAGSAGARGGAASSVFPNMSASAAQQPQRYAHASSAMAHATRLGGGRSSMRMRNSNSDGNLCRWGSTASAVSAVSVASSGAGSSNGHCNGVGDDRTEPQPSSLQSRRPALVELGAAGSSGGAGAAAGGVSAAPMASSARLCRAGSSSLTPMQSCESGEVSPGADEQERAADRHGSTLEAPPTPTPPAVYRNAVTLTLTSPRDEDSASSFSGASGIAGPSSGAAAAHLASGAEDASSPIRSTFTLEAKTRTDFSQPPHHARMSAANTSRAAAEGAAAGASAAAGGNTQSLLESMGSVLGPAAGAVSAAMASAGVALAGVAASASQLLHSTPPASPLRPAAAGASPRRAGAAGAVGAGLGHAAAGPTAASPFAARTAQLPAAAASAAPQRAAAEALSPTHPAMHVVSQSHGTPQHVEQSDQAGPQRVQHPGCATPRVHQPRDQPTTSARRGLTLSPPLPAPSSLPGFRRATSTDQLASSTAGLLLAGQGAASGRGPLFAAALQHGMTATARLGVRAGLHGYGADSGAGADPGLAGSAATSCGGIGAAGQAVPATLSEPGAAAVAADQATPPPAASPPLPPYKLRCVAHSLGGMSVLIHLVNRLREGRPHHVSRLVLLTPAGFHKYFPKAAKPIAWVLPLLARLMRLVLGRSFCFPLYIPTPLGRALTFKLLLSASRIPGLGELMRLGFKAMLDGDISQWDRALQMPHYNEEDMPAISLDQVLHLIQLSSIDCFRLYDYGSSAANRAHYGVSQPPDVSAEYWRLDMPVHLVAGRRDGIIPPANIRRHLDAMRAQGVPVSYREFDFGHLDFTFGVKEELRIYLMKLLRM
ncbi:hypothetical protein HXX76_008031 [Chlamydomonas incerta]|uniref:Partial AB-hydrolase lipase domain-containing protein n=1 Tax=Chlamydomonas incerta TaxID=51695 RepID=A0A835VZI6_CHLIN|nr:hypothetical protein HXX76_008031 [Chlamydomonas incerta]|eukprot:KAG2433660.1 hypothetical protein HXX76_008031 [Chlamydomonas incerta]